VPCRGRTSARAPAFTGRAGGLCSACHSRLACRSARLARCSSAPQEAAARGHAGDCAGCSLPSFDSALPTAPEALRGSGPVYDACMLHVRC
jgi:hypothetical protein